MNKIFKEKYLYLIMFLLVASGYFAQMVYFSRFLSDTKNYTIYTAWETNQRLREEIHAHPDRYPNLNPDGTHKVTTVMKQVDEEKKVPEINNAFELLDTRMEPFRIQDAPKNSITNVSTVLDKPAGKFGFIRVKDGHFYNDKGRFQIAGINNAYNANFPTYEYADVMSLRLARFGFNCVRLHHCDEKDFWVNGNKTVFDEKNLTYSTTMLRHSRNKESTSTSIFTVPVISDTTKVLFRQMFYSIKVLTISVPLFAVLIKSLRLIY
jgi:hypothetical protein